MSDSPIQEEHYSLNPSKLEGRFQPESPALSNAGSNQDTKAEAYEESGCLLAADRRKSADQLEKKFVRLHNEWKAKRGPESSTTKLMMHPAYQTIIGMGPDAIPFLLRELDGNPDAWFWALRSITEANPVPLEIRGDVLAMAAGLVSLGKEPGVSLVISNMPEEYYDLHFPRLRQEGFKRTSEPAYYNCIAYVVGDVRRRWWPGEYDPAWSDDYWPEHAPREETISAFVKAMDTVGYEPCVDGTLALDFEKIALYSLGELVRHAAKQQPDGTWRSKLGSDEDIEHTLTGLEGPLYGNVTAFLRRLRTNP